MMNKTEYTPPVDQLLTYGDCREFRKWPDYTSLGLGAEHIPELIRMATDNELHRADCDSQEVWAPTHAWRALGQLQAEAAVEPLAGLLRHMDKEIDDWIIEEIPEVLAMLGPASIPVLSSYLIDTSLCHFTRIAAGQGLRLIGQKLPDYRKRCLDILTRELEQFSQNDPEYNGFLIWELIDFRALESVEVMKRAYAAESVDESVCGDWEDVEIALGLRSTRTIPREKPAWVKFFEKSQPSSTLRSPGRKERAAKRKQKRQARKKDRQRRRKRK